MDTLQPILSTHPHQFVGYWGYGDESALENQLSEILDHAFNKTSLQPFIKRETLAANLSIQVLTGTLPVWD